MTDFIAVLKSVSDLPKPIIDAGVALITDLLGKPFQESGELLADQVYAWRWANRVRIAQKASKRLADMKIPPAVLPPGFLIPLLESCGNVDEEPLQNMWASLLAEGVRDGRSRLAAYRKTLESLNTEDAKWLMELRRMELDKPTHNITTPIIKTRSLPPGSKGGSSDINSRLLSLGLLVPIVSREFETVLRQPGYSGTGLALWNSELSEYARQFLAVVGSGEFPYPENR